MSKLLLLLSAISTIAYPAKNVIEGKARHYSSYFFDQHHLRHHQYEASLTEKTHISSRLLTIAEGRARTNLSLGDKYSQEVKNDEQLEFHARQFYLDFMNENVRIKAGLQQFDWVETFSPFSTDLLTPYDLRFGGFGAANQVLEPMLSVIANHKLGKGTLEYVLVPLPKHSRFAKGDNGYGYYPALQNMASPLTARVKEEDIPVKWSEVEFGMRYLMNINAIDLTFLGYYGHQRSPSFYTEAISPNDIQITQKYPRVFTLGAFAAYSQDAWVVRGFLFAEPRREQRIQPASLSSPDYDSRYRIGGGFDYLFSKHFKAYSEIAAILADADDYQVSLKLTNETWKDLFLSIISTLTFPKFSYQLRPECSYNLNSYTLLSFGATLIGSNDSASDFESLKNASRIDFALEYNFDFF